ncbi:hypothetical protein D0Y65_023671 [Glycine soja]|uniref:Uncharacterized protein n=1 Tax=Glycine soja TaxID=3848 RepID=A0A445IZ01_GLYSO|nr:hypothetical protein D0Y65_023671 [Glycine soja]
MIATKGKGFEKKAKSSKKWVFDTSDDVLHWAHSIAYDIGFVVVIMRLESAHWALKILLQNSLGDLCSVWEAMNNMMTLQHTEIKASFETSTHVVELVFKVTLYKKLLGIVLRYERIFMIFGL